MPPADRPAKPSHVESLERAPVFQGYFAVDRHSLRYEQFKGGMGPTVSREIFERGHAVCVLPYDAKTDQVVLIEQFRPGPFAAGDPEPWLIETVAGIIDAGESAETVARREAEELRAAWTLAWQLRREQQGRVVLGVKNCPAGHILLPTVTEGGQGLQPSHHLGVFFDDVGRLADVVGGGCLERYDRTDPGYGPIASVFDRGYAICEEKRVPSRCMGPSLSRDVGTYHDRRYPKGNGSWSKWISPVPGTAGSVLRSGGREADQSGPAGFTDYGRFWVRRSIWCSLAEIPHESSEPVCRHSKRPSRGRRQPLYVA